MHQDLMALLYSYLYIGGVVVVGELAKRGGMSTEIARKIIHVGVGLWIFGTLALFTNPYVAAIPPVTAAMGNWVIHKKRLLQSTEAEPENLGTVWFPISFAILILTMWDTPTAIAGGVMAMTIGDAVAATVGIRWGRRSYATFGGRRKSLEGSAAMFAGAFISIWLVMGLYSEFVGLAVLAAVVATCTEALGIKGRDNLWVPLSAGLTIYIGMNLTQSVADALGAGALLASLIGILAWMKGSLSPSGVLGAIITGTLLFGLGGWTGGLALIAFFISSSLLSKLFRTRKAEVEAEYAKTGTRDLGQALANAGVASAAILALALTGDARFLGACLGALAAANADTWATELGVLSPSAPRLITTFRAVPAGTSGAISLAGTLAAAAGAAFVGLVPALVTPRLWSLLPWLALAGLAGAFLDSILGATVQGTYYCPQCQKETEQKRHRCGAPTRLHKGFAWLGNDLVNLLATLAGALVGFVAM
ncbi:MAG: hypothetical protein K0R39_2344 [Symbiobacteriaceae bacterium]|jgi:uncharacterized protein (TIGR00297 family)|nr:hypothetical protein [Symbiobacteriaceae bacterium]